MCVTPAEKHLVDQLAGVLRKVEIAADSSTRILNIGAGRSLSIENQLARAGCRYVSDRIDVEDCSAGHPSVGHCWQCSVEAMSPVPSNTYTAAFANFVLEHVQNIERAATEIHRILRPSGLFVATLSNPSSPTGMLTARTPLWFHRLVRQGESWDVVFSYQSIGDLTRTLEWAGLRTLETRYYSCVESYLHSLPILRELARGCDKAVEALKINSLMSHVCIVLEKAS